MKTIGFSAVPIACSSPAAPSPIEIATPSPTFTTAPGSIVNTGRPPPRTHTWLFRRKYGYPKPLHVSLAPRTPPMCLTPSCPLSARDIPVRPFSSAPGCTAIAPFALPRIDVSVTVSLAPPLTWMPVPSPPVVPITALPVISGALPASTEIPRFQVVLTVTPLSTGALPETRIPAFQSRPAPSTTACSRRLAPDCGPRCTPCHVPAATAPAVVKTIGFSAVPIACSSPAAPSPIEIATPSPTFTTAPGSIVNTGRPPPRTHTWLFRRKYGYPKPLHVSLAPRTPPMCLTPSCPLSARDIPVRPFSSAPGCTAIAPFALPRIAVSVTVSLAPPLTWMPVPSPPVVPITALPVISGALPASTEIPRFQVVLTVTPLSTGALPETRIPAFQSRPAPSTTACSSRLAPDCGPRCTPCHVPAATAPAVVKTIGFSAVPIACSSPAAPSPIEIATPSPTFTTAPGSIVSTGRPPPRTDAWLFRRKYGYPKPLHVSLAPRTPPRCLTPSCPLSARDIPVRPFSSAPGCTAIAPFALPRIAVSVTVSLAPPLTWMPVPSPPVVPITALPVISGALPASTEIPRFQVVLTVTPLSTGALPETRIPAFQSRPAPSTTACSRRLAPDCGPRCTPCHVPAATAPAVVKTIGFSAVPIACSSPAAPSPIEIATPSPTFTTAPGSIVNTGRPPPRTHTWLFRT